MSDDVRADARRLRGALGDIEWRAVGSGVRNGDHWYVCEDGESIAMIAANDGIDEHMRQPRAEFIAAAPELVRGLLAELDQATDDACGTCLAIARAARAERDAAIAVIQQLRPALEEADREHEWAHSCEADDVRCECCDLRYGERDEYTCCSQHGMYNHPHRFDDEELTAARGCAADCPPWYLPLLKVGS